MADVSMRAFGADRIEPGGGEEIVLRCPVSKAWTARTRRTTVRAEHPGTAVAWEDRIFEVRACEPLSDGGMRYRLAPWESAHAIRQFERYDEESEEAREKEWSRRRAAVRHRRFSILLAPLAGLLPGAMQKRMESEFGAASVAMTISSALPLLVIGFLGLFNHILGMAGGSLGWPPWVVPPLPVALFLFGESALRLASAVAGGEPMGSLPAVLAVEVWRAARGRGAPQAAPAPVRDPDRDARDRFRMLEPALAFLSPREQAVLRDRFGFQPVRWGTVTAILLLVVSGLNALVSFPSREANRVSVEWLWLLPSLYLFVEQVFRLVRLRGRAPAGSALGALVRPFAKRLFDAAGAAASAPRP